MVAVADHAVARRKTIDARADLGLAANVAVAQIQRLIQFAAHRIGGGGKPIGADLFQHHLELVGLLAGLRVCLALTELPDRL